MTTHDRSLATALCWIARAITALVALALLAALILATILIVSPTRLVWL